MLLDSEQKSMSLCDVIDFLNKEENHFIKISNTNECRKWSKWLNRNETPFPCACPTRNDDCIFAETYYQLSKVAEVSRFESVCEEAMMDFYSINADDALLKKWIEDNQALHSDISKFKDEIRITKTRTPYEKLTINVTYPQVFGDFKEISI